MQAVERRRWQRVSCEASKQGVLLRLETTDSEDPVLNTFARDVSRGGLSFEVEKSLSLRESLPLKVFFPRTPSPLDCRCRIAWQEANGHATRAGVAFPNLSEEEQRTLEEFLREIGGTTATVEREPRPNLSDRVDVARRDASAKRRALPTSVRLSRLGRGEPAPHHFAESEGRESADRFSEAVRLAPSSGISKIGAGPAEVQETESAPPQRGSRRDQAIWQFEQGVLLYHRRKLGQAKRAFQKVIREYADIIDVARVARRYLE